MHSISIIRLKLIHYQFENNVKKILIRERESELLIIYCFKSYNYTTNCVL